MIGTISTSDVVRGYRLGLQASLRQLNGTADSSGMDQVEVAQDSPLVGQAIRESGLPLSIIVTTIERDRDLVVPNGDTVLAASDQLLLIGEQADIDAFRTLASHVSANADEQ